MLGLLEQIKKIAACDANTLIQGDSGCGNECVALLLHQESQRSQHAFLARSCTAIPAESFETEMFGDRDPAHPSATGLIVNGAFLEAVNGTLYLDEVGDLGYSQQTALLDAIKREATLCVGNEMIVGVRPRIIGSATRQLLDEKSGKQFRHDLYHRLATVVLNIQPLREGRSDIIPLARHFAARASNFGGALTCDAENRLLEHDWPGNIRELRMVIQEAVNLAAGAAVHAEDLFVNSTESSSRLLLLSEVERRHILAVMKSCRDNKTDAARRLGLARSTLILKLRTISSFPTASA
jgi:two-component system, NtrC family, response regulator HydG